MPVVALTAFALASAPAGAATTCRGIVYLTLDTGNMSQAERIAGILQRHGVRATFFLANEATPRGDHALDDSWAEFWRKRVAEGHAFGSHTFDHVYFRGATDGAAGRRYRARPQFGADAGRMLQWNDEQLCAELRRVDTRFRGLTGRGLDPLWRVPGGRAPALVMRGAAQCGYEHVGWSAAGFLGDELPSETYPNRRLLADSLARIRPGDILMAHLGIWSRRDPYAPTLDPLIAGLKARGLCFGTIPEHPAFSRKGTS
ncbi:MAG: polysaccharide deacetylase family protein [Burkholderiaceae bacterium]